MGVSTWDGGGGKHMGWGGGGRHMGWRVDSWDGEVGISKGVSVSMRKGENGSRIQPHMSGEILWLRHLN